MGGIVGGIVVLGSCRIRIVGGGGLVAFGFLR